MRRNRTKENIKLVLFYSMSASVVSSKIEDSRPVQQGPAAPSFPPVQAPFQPGSTPEHLSNRFMVSTFTESFESLTKISFDFIFLNICIRLWMKIVQFFLRKDIVY